MLVPQSQPAHLTFTIGHDPREALLFAPAFATSGKLPLVFAWHGHGGDMAGTARSMHFQTTWPEAIVAYAQGLLTHSTHDQAANEAGWQTELTADNRDLAGVQATVDHARKIDHATSPGQMCDLPPAYRATCWLFHSTAHTPVKQITHPDVHIYPTWAPDEIVKFFKNHPRP